MLSADPSGRISHLMLLLGLLTLASMACGWFPLDWAQWDFGRAPQTIQDDEAISTERWEARRCSALGEVQIVLAEFSEEIYQNSDGSPGGIDCGYSYQIRNAADQPLILLYYDHYFYGEYTASNSYEFGWQKAASLPPGESWELGSLASSVPRQPLYLDLISSLAVVYDTPACAWLTEGGIQREILEIAVQEPLQPPCRLIDLSSAPGAVPDFYLGLAED